MAKKNKLYTVIIDEKPYKVNKTVATLIHHLNLERSELTQRVMTLQQQLLNSVSEEKPS